MALLSSQAPAQAPEEGPRSLVFLGNQALPPMVYLQDGKAKGVAVDLVKRLSEEMGRPVDIRPANWAEAQKDLAEGRVDALVQINPTESRLLVYDFSGPFLDSRFSIFVRQGTEGIQSAGDLQGLRVGVEPWSYPELALMAKPLIALVRVSTILDGFHQLQAGEIEALVADQWVGQYILAANRLRGIEIVGEPVAVSQSAIAVKKGDRALLDGINAGLERMRKDGSYQAIIDRWRPKSIVYETEEQVEARQIRFLALAIGLVLVLSLAFIIVLLQRLAAERSLKAELDWKSGLLDEIGDAIVVVDLEGRIVYVNPSAPRQLGYSREELLGRNIAELNDPETLPAILDHKAAIIAAGSGHFTIRRRRKDGSFFHVDVSARLFSGSKGELIIGIDRDITEMVELRERLMESEAKYRDLFRAESDALLLVERATGIILDCNESALRMYGYSREELLGLPNTVISAEPELTVETTRDPQSLVPLRQHRKKDGTVFPVEITFSTSRLNGVDVVISAARDITERVEASRRITALLREKDLILREAHHRIKNNMASIIGLLAFQRQAHADSPAGAILLDAMAKLQSMGVLYDKLYRSEDTGTSDVGEYLRGLLEQALELFGRRASVALRVEVEAVTMGAARLAPLGIVLNELLTNSLKHAFEDCPAPRIELEGRLSGSDLILVYRDNGRGLPEDPALEKPGGFGLQLIAGLVAQLDGSYEVGRAIGVRFTLRIPV